MLFDEQQFDLESHMYESKSRIEKRANFLLEMIETWREIYQNKINQYSETYDNIRQEITTQFQLIDQHIQIFLKFVTNFLQMNFYKFSFSTKDPDPIKAEHYLQEIKDFKTKLRQRNKQIDAYPHKFPVYTISDFDSSILGTISIQTDIEHIKLIIDDDNNDASNIQEEEEEDDNQSTSSDESQQTIHENDQEEVKECVITSPLTTLANIPNKKLLWSLHFKFVPQYISLYRQSILFASDRWGFVR